MIDKQILGMIYIGQVSNPHINDGHNIPLYKPVSRTDSVNTLDVWNRRADIANTRAFQQANNREPESIDEVYTWLDTLHKKEDHQEGT